jgi:hypothetical protein
MPSLYNFYLTDSCEGIARVGYFPTSLDSLEQEKVKF